MNPEVQKSLTNAVKKLVPLGKIPVIAGATAVGKTSFAISLAQEIQAEIISADSMQFYRGLDIGTAKPAIQERRGIPHHLLDSMDIFEKANIYKFRKCALRLIEEIRGRGHVPLITGGSGLYIHALIYGLDELPNDENLRKQLDERYDNPEHFSELLKIMKKDCPHDAARFAEHRRKLIRAREIFLLTGKELSSLQQGHNVPDSQYAQFILTCDRNALRKRIAQRTAAMLQMGWIEEAETLLAQGLMNTPTAWQAIGYATIGEYLRHRITYLEMQEKIEIATRQYARRQDTWFRNRHKEAVVLSTL